MAPVLSFAQRRLWFLDQLTDNHAAYLTPRTYALTGLLDPDVLEAALRWVVRRHDVLRSRVSVRDGEPYAVYDREDIVRLSRIDLRAEPEPRRAALRRVAELMVRPCDLAAGPLLRAALLRLSENTYLLHYTVHHIAFDGMSRVVFEEELGAAYTALATGRSVGLDPLSMRYADYAEWQRAQVGDAEWVEQEQYWRDRLAGAPSMLELPADRPRPAVPALRGARLRLSVAPEVGAGLRTVARQERTSVFVVTLAAYHAALGCFADALDVLIGVPFAGRPIPELERLVGLFANTVVVRADLAEAVTFRDLVRQVRDRVLEAMDHQDLPFERIVDIVEPDRDADRNPLVQHWFSLVEGDLAEAGLTLPGIECQPVDAPDALCRFDTELELRMIGEQLTGTLVYAAELFDESTMDRFLGCYRRLLTHFAAHPDARLIGTALVGAAERAELLRLAGERPHATVHLPTIGEWFDRQAALTPDAVAVSAAATELTYRELADRAARLSARLRRAGAGPASVVGVFLPRGTDWVVALLAVVKAGAAYLPIDTESPAARVDYLLDDAAACLVLTDGSSRDRLSAETVRILLIDQQDDPGPIPQQSPPAAEAVLYLIYTSGSTGRPKGVAVSHTGFGNLVRWHLDRYPTGPGDRIGQLASSAFDAAGWEVWPALLSGARLEICPDQVVRDPDALMSWLGDRCCTQAFAPTPLAERLIGLPLGERTPLRILRTGGDVFRPAPTADPGVPVVNHYGPTENSVVATATQALRAPWAENSLGRPITGVRAYLIDRHFRLVPRGAAGELCLGGSSVAVGYWRKPGQTAERFLPDPFAGEPGARLYRTGDRARWRSDGTLQFLGRLDEQVMVRGYRIEPAEVEAALLTDPSVAQAVVVSGEGRTGQPMLVGYVVPAGTSVDTEELRARLSADLPAYLVPQAFVTVDSLPMTTSGKLDRKRLPAADFGQYDRIAPRTEVERVLSALWSEVLGVDPVGVTEDFFALGGNSMTAAKLLARIRAAFDIDFPLRGLFDHRTVSRLGSAIEARVVAEIAAMTPDQISAELGQGG
ncbi:amino acid adenylation domain-containing protein [Nocardia sp. NBC_01499]|uniref:non-ribosomal peptide synthetase n=1 Tax=Nocardia sp. NBC_01499 TaxID=2903597 RepID=UPI003868A82C